MLDTPIEKPNSRKLRILINSNGPWAPSGYAQQLRSFLPLIAKAGFPVACTAFYGLEGGILGLDGITFYPKISSTWGDDAMVYHGRHFNADIVFTLQDIWVLGTDTFKALATEKRRVIPIVPIDHEPTPPAILERLKYCYRIVSYSKFGQRQLRDEGFHSTYIPHAFDSNVYKPVDKKEARKKMKIPEDMFIFGMVAANKDNPPRKSFQEAMDAFKMFHDKHPNSGMYFHVLTQQQGGFPIETYAKYLGIQNNIFVGDFYEQMFILQPSDMATVYSSMDVLLAPSQNEGFGMPIVEAQMCGVPVITTDFTSMRDLVTDGENGYKVKVLHKRFDPLLSYSAYPDTNDIYDKMELLYSADREKMSKKCREMAINDYDLTKIFNENWMPFLNQLEKEVYGSDKPIDIDPVAK